MKTLEQIKREFEEILKAVYYEGVTDAWTLTGFHDAYYLKRIIHIVQKEREEAYESGARDFDRWLDKTYQIGVDYEYFLSQTSPENKEDD
jgi:hypothetical protein